MEILYVGCILILNREWMGIDRLRMDKYMLTLRIMFRTILTRLGTDGWKKESVKIGWNRLKTALEIGYRATRTFSRSPFSTTADCIYSI